MDRKQFEEWFKTTDAYKLLEEMNYFKIDLFTFKEHRSQYQHTTVQIAYMTWQHRQAKVEEANAKAQMCRDEKNHAINRWSAVCKERDELKKRVDAALARANQACIGNAMFHKQFDDVLAILRGEQALKGEKE
ncbi:hypothetical protein [Acinetobacter baumannii]|uniref:hypothetical protein n=1 Tax=Acinetobacter baumannii TaxID=470 RepID=UPI003892C5C5